MNHRVHQASQDAVGSYADRLVGGGPGGAPRYVNAVRPRSGPTEQPSGPRLPLTRIIRRGAEITRALHEMPKPTLAVIPGAAAGAGLSLALACDMRFCLDTAKLTTAFAKIGASGDVGGSFVLPRLVGAAKAREMYFLADSITGREALELGLVTRVADESNFDQEARAFAERLAGLPTVTIGLMKQNLNAADGASLNEVLDIEASNMALSLQTRDHRGRPVRS